MSRNTLACFQQRFPKMQDAISRSSYLMQDAVEILNDVLQNDTQQCVTENVLDLMRFATI